MRKSSFWDMESFDMISAATLESHPIRAACFSRGGEALLSCSGDGLKVWGWEPAPVVFDNVEVGWSHLADVAISSADELIGVSFHKTVVSLFLVDLKQLSPFAPSNSTSSHPRPHQQQQPQELRNSSSSSKPFHPDWTIVANQPPPTHPVALSSNHPSQQQQGVNVAPPRHLPPIRHPSPKHSSSKAVVGSAAVAAVSVSDTSLSSSPSRIPNRARHSNNPSPVHPNPNRPGSGKNHYQQQQQQQSSHNQNSHAGGRPGISNLISLTGQSEREEPLGLAVSQFVTQNNKQQTILSPQETARAAESVRARLIADHATMCGILAQRLNNHR